MMKIVQIIALLILLFSCADNREVSNSFSPGGEGRINGEFINDIWEYQLARIGESKLDPLGLNQIRIVITYPFGEPTIIVKAIEMDDGFQVISKRANLSPNGLGFSSKARGYLKNEYLHNWIKGMDFLNRSKFTTRNSSSSIEDLPIVSIELVNNNSLTKIEFVFCGKDAELTKNLVEILLVDEPLMISEVSCVQRLGSTSVSLIAPFDLPSIEFHKASINKGDNYLVLVRGSIGTDTVYQLLSPAWLEPVQGEPWSILQVDSMLNNFNAIKLEMGFVSMPSLRILEQYSTDDLVKSIFNDEGYFKRGDVFSITYSILAEIVRRGHFVYISDYDGYPWIDVSEIERN